MKDKTRYFSDAVPRPDDDVSAGDGPTVPDDAARLREAWIAAVRELHYRREGTESRYTPKAQHDGGKCPQTGRNFKPVWPKIADEARRAGLDPVYLVETLFSGITTQYTPPPQQLTAPANVARCKSTHAAMHKRVSTSLRSEETVFRAAVWAAGLTCPSRDDATRYALNDTSRTLSPLFRYCAAVLYELPDVADRWRAAAVDQYGRHRDAYRQYWAKILPPELVMQAAG